MASSNILVTGAHGFIGRHVAREFAREGHAVIGLGHGSWKPDEWRSWGISRWYEDDVSPDALRRIGDQPEVVVHCAGSGSVGFSLTDPLADFHRTVTTTVSVMDYVRGSCPAAHIVYPSSAGVYGRVTRLPIPEDAPAAPISPYGVHKWLAEQVVVSYATLFKISAAIVRLFSVYGCGLRKQLLWDGCRKLTAGDCVFMGTGNESRDWVHVDDAAKLLSVASSRASTQCPVVNGGTGEAVSVRELLAHLADGLHVDASRLSFSENLRAGDPPAYLADMTLARQWGWSPSLHWRERVAEYASWWQLEMGQDAGRQMRDR